MDEEIYYAQCVLYSYHTVRIGLSQSCKEAKKMQEKYLAEIHSMSDKISSFSDSQLAIYREIESEIMPVMQSYLQSTQMYQMFISNCFGNSYRCLSLPKECDTRSAELWECIRETREALEKLNGLVEAIQCISQDYCSLVLHLNVL